MCKEWFLVLTNVMIDAVNYKIEPTDEVLICDGRECGATVDFNLSTIKVRNEDTVGEGKQAKLIMHEVMHALLYERGFYEEAENEELVDGLAAGLVNLIRANPKLVEFIRGGCHAEDTPTVDKAHIGKFYEYLAKAGGHSNVDISLLY